MTQPAQQTPAGPQTAPAAPTGQPAQPQPPAAPPATPAQPAQPQAPVNPYGYVPPTPPQQQQPPAWQPQQVPGQPPTQPAYPALPYMPPPTVPPAPSDDDGQSGYDLARLPKAAREEIERHRQREAQYNLQLRTAGVTQQAYVLAAQLGANPQALVGSLAWQQAAAQLDPAAPDYQQRLAWTIQALVQANPWMAAPATPSATPPTQQGQPATQQPGPPAQPAGPTVAPITGQPGTVDTSTPGIGRLRNAYGA